MVLLVRLDARRLPPIPVSQLLGILERGLLLPAPVVELAECLVFVLDGGPGRRGLLLGHLDLTREPFGPAAFLFEVLLAAGEVLENLPEVPHASRRFHAEGAPVKPVCRGWTLPVSAVPAGGATWPVRRGSCRGRRRGATRRAAPGSARSWRRSSTPPPRSPGRRSRRCR